MPSLKKPGTASLPRLSVLLDECVDRGLARRLVGHDVKTAPQMGWAGIKNGELLRLAQRAFDVFVTTDRNLRYQQNLVGIDMAIIVLAAKTNQLRDLDDLVPQLLDVLPLAERGTAITIGE